MADADVRCHRLHIVSRRQPKRDVTAKAGIHLSGVFGQLAELQQQLARQILTLEECVQLQRRELADTMGQLPEMKEKINWLVARVYEQDRKDVTLGERVGREETAMVNIASAVRSLCESQARWKATMERLAEVLARARSIQSTASPEITAG